MDKLKTITKNALEVVTEEELHEVLKKPTPKGYIGFEPSGTVHLGWKICTNKIKDFLDAGFHFTVLLADWHAYINDKLGGDIEKIKLCGKYMQHCFAAMGVDVSRVDFVYASDYVGDSKYWETVLRTSKAVSVARVKRAMDIMGRDSEEAEKDLSKLFYPAMQVSDIFYLDVDVAYGGTDQRHAHMLARDVAKKLGRKAPVAIHTPLLTGLEAGGRMNPLEAKMSKSKPDSMISIHDDEESVKRKIKKAYCPEGHIEGNPILEMCKFVVFPELNGDVFMIERPDKFGGNLSFNTYEDLEKAFVEGLHPLDLKQATANAINRILAPVHHYFEQHEEARRLMDDLGVITR